jgi:hypothetical protein
MEKHDFGKKTALQKSYHKIYKIPSKNNKLQILERNTARTWPSI